MSDFFKWDSGKSGDMLKTVYDPDEDGKIAAAQTSGLAPTSHTHGGGDITSQVADAAQLIGVAGANFLQRLSANRPGVYKLYRNDSDDPYNLQITWDGVRWLLRGYYADTYHAPARVDYADNAPWSGISGKPAGLIYYPVNPRVAHGQTTVGTYDTALAEVPTSAVAVAIWLGGRWTASNNAYYQNACVYGDSNKNYGGVNSNVANVNIYTVTIVPNTNVGGTSYVRQVVAGANMAVSYFDVLGYFA